MLLIALDQKSRPTDPSSQLIAQHGSLFAPIAKLVPLLIMAMLLIGGTGCTSTRTLSFASSESQSPVYEQGVAVLQSQQTNGVVVRVLTPEFTSETNSLPALLIYVSNGTDKSFDFSANDIEVLSGKSRVKVYSYEEMQKRIKRESALLAFALAMNAAGQSMQASMPKTSYTSGSVNAYGAGGYSYANYSGYTTTYNPAAAASAQAQINANMMNQMSMVATTRSIQLNDTGSFLRRNTVMPGKMAGGVVKLHAQHIKKGKPLRLRVTAGGEAHEFALDVGK